MPPTDTNPVMPSELWMLWSPARENWVTHTDSVNGIKSPWIFFSDKAAQVMSDHLAEKNDIRCTPVRVDQPERFQVETLLTTGIIAPPLFELPCGMWIDPREVTSIDPADSGFGAPPRVNIGWATGEHGRSAKTVSRHDTLGEAIEASRDLARRINAARNGEEPA